MYSTNTLLLLKIRHSMTKRYGHMLNNYWEKFYGQIRGTPSKAGLGYENSTVSNHVFLVIILI